MCDTDSGDPRVMHDPASHPRTLYESCQQLDEIARLANQPTRGRPCPLCELLPGTLLCGGGISPDLPIGHHAEELVATGPRNGPCAVTFCQCPHNRRRLRMKARLAAVRVHRYVGVNRYHCAGRSSYIISRRSGQEYDSSGSRPTGVADTQIAHTVCVGRITLGKDIPKSLLDHRAQRAARGLGMALCACQQLILNVDCGLHEPILPIP